MAIIPGTYYQCDQCAQVWAPLKRDQKLRCPGCRTRKWNSKQAAVFVPESGDGSIGVQNHSNALNPGWPSNIATHHPLGCRCMMCGGKK